MQKLIFFYLEIKKRERKYKNVFKLNTSKIYVY